LEESIEKIRKILEPDAYIKVGRHFLIEQAVNLKENILKNNPEDMYVFDNKIFFAN
jgi:hypothetical protein